MNFRYTVYGLNVKSELCLPELPHSSLQAVDVKIRQELGAYKALANASVDRQLHLTPMEAYLAWDRIGIFLVRNGNEIIYSPAPNADADMVRLPLLGLVFAVLLHQRGYLVLHGSVVASKDNAIAFLGHKGHGKSTISAALRRQGYAFVSDDTAALDLQAADDPIVLPGFPHQKLWPDALTVLGENTNGLQRLFVETEKRHFPIRGACVCESTPLRGIYLLSRGEELEIVPMKPREAMIQLLPHLSLAPFGNQLFQAGHEAHFAQCGDLVRRVPVYELKRPYSLDLLDETAQMISAHSQAEVGLEIA